METAILDWLSRIGTTAFYWSLGLFVIINSVAAMLFISRQNREFVNRWTSRVLAIDLLLLGTGVGIPLVTGLTRLTVSAVSAPFANVSPAAPMSSPSATELTPARR